MARPPELNLPTDPVAVQAQNKAEWNAERCSAPDFFTVGYTGRDMQSFVAVLVSAGVQTVLDVRFAPVSQYKPDFSKSNLQRHLASVQIEYLHKRELGVPRDIRGLAAKSGSRNAIWDWYDANVLPMLTLQKFFNWASHPVAILCLEFDPTSCHRHRLALELERHGLNGRDL